MNLCDYDCARVVGRMGRRARRRRRRGDGQEEPTTLIYIVPIPSRPLLSHAQTSCLTLLTFPRGQLQWRRRVMHVALSCNFRDFDLESFLSFISAYHEAYWDSWSVQTYHNSFQTKSEVLFGIRDQIRRTKPKSVGQMPCEWVYTL